MKKVYLFICALFSAAFTNCVNFMDEVTKRKVLSGSGFESMDDEQGLYEDENSYEEFKAGGKVPTGKAKPTQGTRWMPSNGYFTINIVNAIVGSQQIELFNSLRSWASVTNSLLSAFNPFTFTNRDAANANSTIVYAPNGDLVVTSAAGTTLTINCPDIPYKTLVETLKFYRINVAKMKYGFTNTPQLSNVLNFTEQTFLGRNNTNTLLPKRFFDDTQFQSKQVTITNSFIIDGERGINFLVNSGETIDMTFILSAIAKN